MVAAALVVFPVDIAAAQSAVPPDTFRQDAGPMVGDDAGPEPANCPSAVARQKRLASAAEVKRMTRAAHIVTKETLAQATALAASWWERQGVAFIEDSTLRGHQHQRVCSSPRSFRWSRAPRRRKRRRRRLGDANDRQVACEVRRVAREMSKAR